MFRVYAPCFVTLCDIWTVNLGNSREKNQMNLSAKEARMQFINAVGMAGFVALVLGLGKAAAHMFVDGAICASSLSLDFIVWSLSNGAHCWGCPVAMTGLAMLGGALVLRMNENTSGAAAPALA